MNRSETPSASEFGDLISFLAQNGMTAQAARQVVGNSPNGRTRQQISDELRAWLKDRPKAQTTPRNGP